MSLWTLVNFFGVVHQGKTARLQNEVVRLSTIFDIENEPTTELVNATKRVLLMYKIILQ